MIKVAIIGLDTSHSIEFPRRMQAPDCPEDQKVPGLKAVSCLRFPTPFQNKDGLDQRQKQLEAWDVKVTADFDEAAEGADAFMLEINDGSYHLEYFKKVAALGKPVFLDKPLAATLADGKAIIKLMKQHATRVWSGSSIPFCPEITQVKAQVGEIRIANVFGALGAAPAGDSLVWYGAHTFEMLQRLMGCTPQSIQAIETKTSIVTIVNYGNDRQGLVEAIRNCDNYGGLIIGKTQGQVKAIPFICNTRYSKRDILCAIKKFFKGGPAPVDMMTTFEGLAMITAARKSIETRKAVKFRSHPAGPI
ncbi:MAG: Gfo/Idh/MocA family oxidoreductase [Verrucomicrobia bacterium]|nr:Gfo/Idh/MocA family oxidoreductase [Verrucomicrobiota bacterium]MBU4290308.1 Gfo/Idh/MocA family oxidoreductase [Verrucomicrobiota bacterium]MBU4428022.1 Gfo/Idh/MocA family oxidoreductase [Verrucomicrobiota bacterium]MCG2679518.1 Gfo/Idh/MocA family oxidoreductase [Kiritimatiellia bacterium]